MSPRWLWVLLAAQPPREVQRWPSLASVERTTQRPRRSGIRIVRALEERGLLKALPRNFAVRKAGAT